MNNYQILEDKILFSCGCEFKHNGNEVSFNPDLHDPTHTIDFECPATYELLSEGLTEGVFQLGSPLGKQWCKKLLPTEMEHISSLGSILRPGCLESKDTQNNSITVRYERKKNGKMGLTTYHPIVDEILKDTYGELIYQEGALELAKQCAGFSLSEADTLRKCVTDDTMFISKTRGWISIKELLQTGYEEDYFLIMDENGKQTWSKIEKIWSTGKQNVDKIKTKCGYDLKITKYHKLLTNNGWKARTRLQESDYLVVTANCDFDGFDYIDSSLMFVLAGILCEGYFADNKNGCTFVNYDSDMLKWFQENFYSYFGENPTLFKNGQGFYIKKEIKKKLNKYITYGLSDKKYLPKEALRLTKETTRKFLSFMLGCEGGVCEHGQFDFSSKSLKMVKQVKLLLTRFNIHSWITNPKIIDGEKYYRLYINTLEDQKRILDKLCDYWPSYKREAFKRIVDAKESQFTRNIVPNNIVVKLIDQYPYIIKDNIYNKNVSRSKFNRLCSLTNDPIWELYVQGLQRYESFEQIDNPAGKRVNTYDFTIANNNTPFIVANGIVISNSIGKKIPELMSQCKKDFLRKGKELGIFTDQQLEEIFGWIEASQRYSFNHSHAWSYGLNAYITAYQKAHFPLSFYKSWLANEDKRELYTNFVNEAKLFDINIYPPDLRHNKTDFYIKNKHIYFGLHNIKGLVKKDLDALTQTFMEKNWKFEEIGKEIDWLSFLSTGLESVSSKTAEALIHSGALDCFNMDRAKMFYEYERWNELSNGEKKCLDKNKESLSDFIRHLILDHEFSYENKLKLYKEQLEKREGSTRTYKTELKEPTENRRLPKLRKILEELAHPLYNIQDTVDSVIFAEENLLGVALSKHKTDEIPLAAETATCLEVANGRKHRSVLKVKIDKLKSFTCKNGEDMCFMDISDKTTQISAIAFSKSYVEYRHLLTRSNLVFVSGQLGDKGSFIIDKVYPIG